MADFGTKRPDRRDKCWAIVLQPSTGAMFRGADNCSNKARPGKLTCHRHDRFEAEAQKQSLKPR